MIESVDLAEVDLFDLHSHADLAQVSRDYGTFSSHERGVFLHPDQVVPLDLARNLLRCMDPPRHTQYRLILQKAFTPHAGSGLALIAQHVATEEQARDCGLATASPRRSGRRSAARLRTCAARASRARSATIAGAPEPGSSGPRSGPPGSRKSARTSASRR